MEKRRVLISKEFAFEAGHHLPDYKGDCARVHGHSYTGEVVISGFIMKNGFVLDYKQLKEAVNLVVMQYDHQDLNAFFENPTAEIMVAKMFDDMVDFMSLEYPWVTVEKVSLKETAKSTAWMERKCCESKVD